MRAAISLAAFIASAAPERRRGLRRFTRMVMHNHLSMVHHFNTDDETIGREILDFVAKRR